MRYSQQHPLPQDITGYQFHIVGNMTLKQFAEVGAGCFIGFLVYTTNLAVFIKWPLIGLVVALGAAAAFVPFEERPFDHWITTFVKVMYKPTKYFWEKESVVPDPFLYEAKKVEQISPEIDLSPARRQRIREYMQSLSSANQLDAFDAYEQQRITQVLNSFSKIVATYSDIKKQSVKPTLKVRVRDLKQSTEEPQAQIKPTPAETPKVDKKIVNADQVAENISIPEEKAVKTEAQQPEQEERTPEIENKPTQVYIAATQAPKSTTPTVVSHFNQNLPFPNLPKEPNKPVGMVLGTNNEIINNAIVEIVSEKGTVVRAVKTNSLGQFFITTPLNNGTYSINAEKDGFVFTNQSLELVGEVVPPIEIKANA